MGTDITRGMRVIYKGLFAIVVSKGLNSVTVRMEITEEEHTVGYSSITVAT